MNESLRFTNKIGIPDDVVGRIRARTRVILTAHPDCAKEHSGQVMLEVAANLLCRLFPHVEVRIEPVPTYFSAELPLDEYLRAIIRDGYLWDEQSSFGENLSEVSLVIGGGVPETEDAIFIDADGWLAYVGRTPNTQTSRVNHTVPIGAVVAACLGVSEIFKIAYQGLISKPIFEVGDRFWLNTLTYNDDLSKNPDIGTVNFKEVVLFGCGSVGSSLLYTLGFLPDVTGELHLVDRDPKVDMDNRQRYVMLTTSDVSTFKGIKKVEWAKAKTSRRIPRLTVKSHDCGVVEFLDTRTLTPGIRLAISAVDNVQARIEIADCLAYRTVNAGTGDTTLTITRHGFADGKACLACDYTSQIPNVSWFQQVSQQIGIPVERVAALLEGGALLSDVDIRKMVSVGFVTSEQIESMVNTDLASLVNRKLYAAIGVQTESKEETPVTAAYIAAMTGALLASEVIKELCGLETLWDSNKYRMDMLSVPTLYTMYVPPGSKNCLCHHHFRKRKYEEVWGVQST